MIDHDNLEEFHDPANYDVEQAANAAPRRAFYGDLVQAIGGPVLETACGTGLISIPMARRGLAVTGTDMARPMLDYARSKAHQQQLTIQWIEADARQLALGAHFPFIFLTGNAFQAFLQRQSVPWAMSFWGVLLIIPTSWRRLAPFFMQSPSAVPRTSAA